MSKSPIVKSSAPSEESGITEHAVPDVFDIKPDDAPPAEPEATIMELVGMVAPVPSVPLLGKAVPRVRGTGPTCPIAGCGSGMIQNRGADRTNHPFRVIRYYRCLREGCPGTLRREERK